MITVIFTCFNRKEMTINCIRSLVEGNPQLDFRFVIVDDHSTDGTVQALKTYVAGKSVLLEVIEGDGKLYWSGGMREGMKYAKKMEASEFCLLINDDVVFYPHTIEKMFDQIKENQVLIGAMCDKNGKFSYGGIKYTKGIKYDMIEPGEKESECDTFNANCVLIPWSVFIKTPIIDDYYVHSLGDFDYGLSIRRRGVQLLVTNFYVGVCPDNAAEGTWQDAKLSRMQRLRLKEMPKGAPVQQWFYYLHKNFGLFHAMIYSVTPYIRILLGR